MAKKKIRRRRCSKCRGVGHNSTTCKKKAAKKTTRKKVAKKATKKTARKKAKKKTTTKKSWMVNASFKPTQKQSREAFHSKIRKAAKKSIVGSGCHLQSGRCDVDFIFKSETAAKQCKTRIGRLKGVTARVHSFDD